MKIPFVGGAYADLSTNLNAQQCINLYVVLDNEGGKEQAALYGTPGLKEFGDSGDGTAVRMLYVLNGELFTVIGDTLYLVSSDGTTFTDKGTLDGSVGYLWVEDNGTQMMIVDNGDGAGYIYSNLSFAKITDEDFPIATGLAYQSGLFVVNQKDTDSFFISGSYDGTTWNALDFASAEGSPDKTRTLISDHLELWIFGEKTTEVWFDVGDADFPFRRRTFIETGIGAVGSVAKIENSVYWFSNRKQIVRAPGYRDEVISTRQIDYQIGTYDVTSDAIGFTYTQNGGIFYELTFPTENITWVYDETTGLWCQRLSYPSNGRHRTNCVVLFNKKILVGDYENSKIYEQDIETYTDNSEEIRKVRTCQTINADRDYVKLNKFEIEFEAGVGLTSGQGSDPQAMLRWSDDGGHKYSNEHWRSMGKKGKRRHRARWNKQGRTRNRIYELVITDPVKTVILGAYLTARRGK